MNTMSTLQTVARLDSERVFRRIIDAALDTGTEQLLEWVRFQPEQFGIDTPRHAPILAKKITLPHYALLNDEAQSACVEAICEQLEKDSGMSFSYVVNPAEGIISIYVASHEVDPSTLIELFENMDDDDFEDEDEDDEDEDDDYHANPSILIGCDINVEGELRTVVDVDEEDNQASLDDGTSIDIDDIFVNKETGEYFLDEEPGEEEEDEDEDDEEEHDTRAQAEDDHEENDDAFEEEPSTLVVVPQIRDTSENAETAKTDDDFEEEELQPIAETVNEEQALAAAIAEEQQEQVSVQADATAHTEAQAEAPVTAPEGTDAEFEEEPQQESAETSQNAAQDVSPTTEDKPSAVEGVSESELARRVALLEAIKEQLPNDSVSEITGNVLTVFMVKGDQDHELTITVTQQLFAQERMIDIFTLATKDGLNGKRSTNVAAILTAIEEL